MPRVDELATELGITSSEALERLQRLGFPTANGATAVDDAVAERLRTDVREGVATPSAEGSTAVDAPEAPGVGERGEGGGAAPGATGAARDDGAAGATPAAGEDGTARTSRRTEPRSPRRKSLGRRFLAKVAELPLLVIVAFVIAVVIKTFLVQAFYIPSGSMIPTLRKGDRVLVEKVTYFFGGADRGDVVVFAKSVFGKSKQDLPWHEDARNFLRELVGLRTGSETDYIKRVVAVGGDSVRYEGNPRKLYINGEEVDEPYLTGPRNAGSELTSRDCKSLKMDPADGGCRVPAGMVFVMGDNRNNSEDSRVIGPIDEDKIVGHAFVLIWPPSNFGGL